MSKFKFLGVAAIFVLCAATAMATNFRAADQVYVPAVIHVGSATTPTFMSDVYISNLSTDSVSVSVIYCPQGITGCSGTAATTLTNLMTLAPNERRELIDFVALPQAQGGLGLTSGFGQVVFNGCKANSSCGPETQDANGVSPNYRNISVETRVYSIPAGTTASSNPPTVGQLFSGYPWYNFVSQEQSNNGLDKVFINGVRATGANGTAGTYRTNIGLVNASQFSNTTMVVKLFNSLGTQVGNAYTTQLGPLASVQVNVTSMFPNTTGSGYWVTVEQQNSTATSDAPAACAPPNSNGCPAFFAYGSVLDNISQDATTLEPQYMKPLTDAQIGCIYPAPGQAACKGTSIMRRAVRK